MLPLFISDQGRPKILYKIFFIGTRSKFIHSWVSKNVSNNDIILDVGAHNFTFTKYQNVNKIFGIDLISESAGYLGWYKERLKKLSKRKNLFPIFGNCEEMPFADSSFNKIIMTEVIEHVERDESAVTELARVIRNDGILFITTPNGNEVEKTNPYHLRHYTPTDLFNLLKKSFNHVEIQIKFPNTNLYVKQSLSKNQHIIKKMFWKYIYEIWYFFNHNNYPNTGYTIIAICRQPIKKTNINNNKDEYSNIIACPKCKLKLKRKDKKNQKEDILICKKCNNTYPYKYGIPMLFTNIPHHQQGPPSSFKKDWEKILDNK